MRVINLCTAENKVVIMTSEKKSTRKLEIEKLYNFKVVGYGMCLVFRKCKYPNNY